MKNNFPGGLGETPFTLDFVLLCGEASLTEYSRPRSTPSETTSEGSSFSQSFSGWWVWNK